MNTTDYSDKVNGLLSDEKTHHKITRNPTTSTEKSLNKLLLQIKDQPAPHDSSMKQLEPKLYYNLHSTDSTPASFHGVPKIHKEDVPSQPPQHLPHYFHTTTDFFFILYSPRFEHPISDFVVHLHLH